MDKAANFTIRGYTGKRNIAGDGLPTFNGIEKGGHLGTGDMHFTDSLEGMERAYDDWKAGTWSKDPYLDMLIPSQNDPTLAPQGKHMMTVFVQYAPPRINGGEWTDEDKAGFEKSVIDKIAALKTDGNNRPYNDVKIKVNVIK